MTRMTLVALIIVCLFCAACAEMALVGVGAAVGVAAYQYYHGQLTVIYEAPFIETWDATLEALGDMSLEVWSKDHDLTSGKIVAHTADQETVTLSLAYRSARETEVVIRVGCLGDKDASMAIKERIREALFRE